MQSIARAGVSVETSTGNAHLDAKKAEAMTNRPQVPPCLGFFITISERSQFGFFFGQQTKEREPLRHILLDSKQLAGLGNFY